jgi:anthranilate phosphoribosyltransferase
VNATEALRRLLGGESLTAGETERLFGALMDGELTAAQQAGLLVALAAKGEAPAEIAGAARAMRARVRQVPHHREGVVDTCGTGGDGRGSFNVSTAAALTAAAAGAPIAKHGNRSVSSRSGSADVLEALGVRVDLEPEDAARLLDEEGVTFLFAPRLHPAMRVVMPVRRELGVRTLFNLLGPLTNPAGARRQLLGVYDPGLVEPLARVLAELGCEHALVVHGCDGLDELTLSGPTLVAEVRAGAVATFALTPQEAGVEPAPLAAVAGGDPAHNAALMERLLAGERGPLHEVTVFNAGAALLVAGVAATLREGVALAREVLASGAAAAKLDALRRLSAAAGGA